jgi:hypothetical protein
MAETATTSKAAVKQRRELAEELLALFRKHADAFARIDDLKSALRKLATDAGENFKEEFAGKGAVKVSGAHDAVFKGILPEVDIGIFLALPEKERDKLVDDKKVIKMVPTYGKPYYGSVTVDPF